MTTSPAHIARLQDVAAPARTRAEIEAIFWETVSVIPETAEARDSFFDLWFGQYLHHDPELVFVALAASGAAIGYLVGTTENAATSPRFASLAYFQTFAEACARYPAHLHINLTAAARGQGIGGALIAAFAAEVRRRGLGGCHVVTGAAARNVAFYHRLGFREIDRSTNARGHAVVFLGLDVMSPRDRL